MLIYADVVNIAKLKMVLFSTKTNCLCVQFVSQEVIILTPMSHFTHTILKCALKMRKDLTKQFSFISSANDITLEYLTKNTMSFSKH